MQISSGNLASAAPAVPRARDPLAGLAQISSRNLARAAPGVLGARVRLACPAQISSGNLARAAPEVPNYLAGLERNSLGKAPRNHRLATSLAGLERNSAEISKAKARKRLEVNREVFG